MMATTANDVFQDNSPLIVDCDVLEAAKENVQPLASGRRVTSLSAILATPHAQREAKLSATRTRLRINVEIALDDDDDDPLEAYCRLVYWTVENYPQGHSAESGLLELLEEATRVLKDDRDGIWRGELKYLKLWVLYASFVEKPIIIYKFLIANEIGTDFALLYEEYAGILERDGRRTEADEVYILGIARQASPLDRLQNRHREFQKRMMCAAPLPAPSPLTAPSAPRRTILGTTALSPSTSATPSSRTLSSQNDVFTASPAPAPSSTSNGRLQIFVDASGPDPQPHEGATNAWPDLGTRKTRIKENVPEVKKMSGTIVKQAGRSKRVTSVSGSSMASTSRIVPYRDPGPNAAEMPPPPVPISKRKSDTVPKTPAKGIIVPFRDEDVEAKAGEVPATPKFTPFRDESASITTPTSGIASVPESVMKAKKGDAKGPLATSEAEALRKDPLKNYGAEAGVELND